MNALNLFKKRDILLIAILLVLALGLLLGLRFAQNKKQTLSVVISHQGEILYHEPITKNTVFISPYNPEVKIEVKDGKASFIHSDCPDQICVNTGWITKAGKSAACAPNKTILFLEGEVEDSELDATTQ